MHRLPCYTPLEIIEKRVVIHEAMRKRSAHIKLGAIEQIAVSDLLLLFALYDEFFLHNWFSTTGAKPLIFSLSKRMTRSAGMTLYQKKRVSVEKGQIEIRMSVDFLFNFDEKVGVKSVGGIEAADGLDALLLIFEHELCHAIEFAATGKSSCRQKPFKKLIQKMFGHTSSTHALPTFKEIAKDSMGLIMGHEYCFVYKSQTLRGQLVGINKRAVMMVPDANGPHRNHLHQKFSKFYVELHQLFLT